MMDRPPDLIETIGDFLYGPMMSYFRALLGIWTILGIVLVLFFPNDHNITNVAYPMAAGSLLLMLCTSILRIIYNAIEDHMDMGD